MGINIIMAKAKSSKTSLPTRKPNEVVIPNLLGDIRQVIEAAREQTARAVNSALVSMYWQIGKRIREDVLQNERAEYGKEIVSALSAQLTTEYGKGFGQRNLEQMIRFAEVFPDSQIAQTLSAQLSWSHFTEIIRLEDSLKRDFYAEMCRVERWSVRTLRHKIGHLLFERTAVAKKPDELIADDIAALRDEDRLTPDMVFRDPYFLDFLGLRGFHSEKDVEAAILRELEAFILELGTDFAFVARQKRITIDNDVQPGEAAPLGLILCAEKSAEHVELLQLENSGIRVAQYLTELPDRRLLERKIHDAVLLARERLATQDQRRPNQNTDPE